MPKSIKLLSAKNFEIIERMYNAHWFLLGYSCIAKFGGGRYIKNFIATMDNGVTKLIFDTDEYNKSADYNADRLINDGKWRNAAYKKFEKYAKKYFIAGERLRKLPLEKLSESELIAEIKKILSLQYHVRILGVLLNGVVIDGRNHLSDKIRDELKQSIPDTENFGSYWSLLTQVTKMSIRQKKDFEIAKLAEKFKKNSLKNPKSKLKKIHDKYCWLGYMYLGPPIKFEQFQKEFDDVLSQNKNISLKKELTEIKKKQKALMAKLNLNKRARFLIHLAQQVIWQKGWRKDAEYHGFYCYEKLFREIAARKNESDWQSLLYLFPWEIINFISDNTPSISELKERRNFSCFIVAEKENKLLIKKEAQDFYKELNLEKDYSNKSEVKGQCAHAGKVRGRVKIIHVPEEMEKINSGDILVSQATSPDILPAMLKASGIVTNTGGLICHAAIIAREFKIPCIVGTMFATLAFKDNDLVEVDATKGVVRKITIKEFNKLKSK